MKVLIILLITSVAICNCLRNPLPDHTDNNFQNLVLEAHNGYRARHSAPKLTISKDLVIIAQNRCRFISQYDQLNAGHDKTNKKGENLYWSISSSNKVDPLVGKKAVDAWYKEKEQYDFNNPGFSGTTGHFTQLVWKATKLIGSALCYSQGSSSIEYYVVSNYDPPGNVLGNFPNNVSPN